MRVLEELVTNETPILNLDHASVLSLDERIKILENSVHLQTRIHDIDRIYKVNERYYLYKENDPIAKNLDCYPYGVIDEMMGSYLCKERKLATVDFEIASLKSKIGLALKDDKDPKFEYFDAPALHLFSYPTTLMNLAILCSLCADEANKNQLLTHFLKLVSIDLYMIQHDRTSPNLIFQKNRETGTFDFAPIMEFSNCGKKIVSDDFFLPNVIINLNRENVQLLLQHYPKFYTIMNETIQYSMYDLVKQIASDYALNQNCLTYRKMMDYYQEKEKDQREYFSKILIKQKNKDIQMSKKVI